MLSIKCYKQEESDFKEIYPVIQKSVSKTLSYGMGEYFDAISSSGSTLDVIGMKLILSTDLHNVLNRYNIIELTDRVNKLRMELMDRQNEYTFDILSCYIINFILKVKFHEYKRDLALKGQYKPHLFPSKEDMNSLRKFVLKKLEEAEASGKKTFGSMSKTILSNDYVMAVSDINFMYKFSYDFENGLYWLLNPLFRRPDYRYVEIYDSPEKLQNFLYISAESMGFIENNKDREPISGSIKSPIL